jgi:hypothetical protein
MHCVRFSADQDSDYGRSDNKIGEATYFDNRPYIKNNYNGQNEKALVSGRRAAIFLQVALGG